MENKIIRPNGCTYILSSAIIYVILVALTLGSILTIMQKEYLWLIVYIIPIILLVSHTRNIISCKILFTDSHIHVSDNNDLLFFNRQDISISYDDLKYIQYHFHYHVPLVSVIEFYYNNGNVICIDALKFSKKQIDYIIGETKELAEKYNSYNIEIKPESVDEFLKSKSK